MTRWTRVLTDIAAATSFLTRYPIPARMQTDPPAGAGAAWAFPLAAALAMVVPAIMILVLSAAGAGPALVALLAISASIWITGALHEDGLADCADGLFGGQTREKALAIMKDSQTGAYGALALILSVALRAAALAELIAQSPQNAALLFIAAATGGRTGMVCQWFTLPAARADGAAVTLGRPGKSETLGAIIICIILITILSALAGLLAPALLALGAVAISTYSSTRFVDRRIQGHTGDTLGATAQIGEIVFLVALVILI